uniref:Mitochondrial pyruvate carrier n=1 Tax=Parastrongyloides trichosuri TaxID=131310 RepID=A0A0N5A526_PARTI
MASRVYQSICRLGDKVIYPLLPSFAKPIWNNTELGPKSVFFWAPTIKWALVIASLGDLRRPAEKLSTSQNTALFATGGIWTRYCFVITPVNYYLASVNFLVMCTAAIQLARIGHFKYTSSS